MGKKKIAVAIVLTVLIIGAISFYYLKLETQIFTQEPEYQEPEYFEPPPPPEVIDLEVNLLDTLEEWKRGADSLPVCDSKVNYIVYNHGNKDSPETNITIMVDDEIYSQNIISIPSESYVRESVILTTKYTETHSIKILASAEESQSVESQLINPVFPRSFTSLSENVMKLYVTPLDPVVKRRADTILEDKPFWDIRADWNVILDWVKNNIDYEEDSFLHNKIEYWQLPRETLASRKGDCEDQALLLCSMLRAKGYSTDEVYVILGFGEDTGHAWVTLKVTTLFVDHWEYLEPTNKGWYSGAFEFFYKVTGQYEKNYGGERAIFNDNIIYGE